MGSLSDGKAGRDYCFSACLTASGGRLSDLPDLVPCRNDDGDAGGVDEVDGIVGGGGKHGRAVYERGGHGGNEVGWRSRPGAEFSRPAGRSRFGRAGPAKQALAGPEA